MPELVFYKAKYGKLLDKLISAVTFGPYSHVEFRLDDGDARTARCFSSSFRDGGVRFKTLDLTTGRWVRYALPPHEIPPNVLADLEKWCCSQVGAAYDIVGVLLVAVTWWRQRPVIRDKWFCSEICSYICRAWALADFPTTQISPSRLERLCRRSKTISMLDAGR